MRPRHFKRNRHARASLLRAALTRLAKVIREPLAAFVALTAVCLSGAAEASGRAGLTPQDVNSPDWRDAAPAIAAGAAWRTGSQVVDEARRWLGSGKFTPWAGPWCADAVSACFVHVGKPPLANRLAASALPYGPHVANPSPGDLVVMRTHRSYVGVVADGSIYIISGNWARRVAEADPARRGTQRAPRIYWSE